MEKRCTDTTWVLTNGASLRSDGRPSSYEDGHDHAKVLQAYQDAGKVTDHPVMIIAKTIKGKGVSFLAGERGWHGKALDQEKLEEACRELGDVDRSIRGRIAKQDDRQPRRVTAQEAEPPTYEEGDAVPTRNAYGNALRRLAGQFPDLIALDGEVCNSTRAKFFRDQYPTRFFEMYVAEQNMVGAALGLALRGKLPFVSTFAAFLTRAFDQIRMSQYSEPNLKFVMSTTLSSAAMADS